MRRVLLALAVVVGCTLVGPPAWADHSGDVDCEDFASPAEAQAHFNAHPDDDDRLDADGDGLACESPSASGAAATSSGARRALAAPSGGGLAQTGSSIGPLTAFAACLIVFGALLVWTGYVRLHAWSTTAEALSALERISRRL